ncbi:ATP-binding cassette domain-containing protein [Cutibacterium equinum]|uniref:ATP-binding cassette domain-containing protein n=1 Tax=Cutibacterium equinum TaxID=3016342 RepID=A0ABY7QZD5_9ACTN|nr:ATP-binding cassette domain-containing protein [Cutibacterium equinum]WCC79844.1 ATP-binding cassette domain-containing protein [Cutibacterium equinum]
MLKFDNLGLWMPHSGLVFHGVNAEVEPGEILVIAGRNGSGASMLLNALLAQLPPGSRRQGRISIGGQDVTSSHPGEYASQISAFSSQWVNPSARIGEVCRRADPRIVAELDANANPEVRVRQATDSQRVRANLAVALSHPGPVLLLDQPLTLLESRWHATVADLIAEQASAGKAVVVSDHTLTWLLERASKVLELGPTPRVCSPDDWWPSTIAPTSAQILARHLGVKLSELGGATKGVDFGPRPHLPHSTNLESLDLDCGQLLRPMDAPSVIYSPSAESLAEFQAELTEATQVTALAKPDRATSVAKACRKAEKASGLAKYEALNHIVKAGLNANMPFSKLSGGHQRLLIRELALLTGTLIVEPDHMISPNLWLAPTNLVGNQSPIILTTNIETATRFRQVAVVNQGKIIAQGSPSATLAHIDERPYFFHLTSRISWQDISTDWRPHG